MLGLAPKSRLKMQDKSTGVNARPSQPGALCTYACCIDINDGNDKKSDNSSNGYLNTRWHTQDFVLVDVLSGVHEYAYGTPKG